MQALARRCSQPQNAVGAVDMSDMVNTDAPSTPPPSARLSPWVEQSLLAGAIAGSLAAVTIAAVGELVYDSANETGAIYAVALVVCFGAAILNSLRFRAFALLSLVAGAATAWQWFTYTTPPSMEHWFGQGSHPNLESACIAATIVGLAVTAACAITKIATGQAPRHPKGHRPRGEVLCWIVAGGLIPAAFVWGTLLQPIVNPAEEVGVCLEHSTDPDWEPSPCY